MTTAVAHPQEGAKFTEDFRSELRYHPSATMDRHSTAAASEAETPKRSGTLKKWSSVKKRSRPGSVRSVQLGEPESRNSFMHTPMPTQSNPTEILVNRFQAWRRVLKDYIAYFREVQAQYEVRARGMNKIMHTLNSAPRPSDFVPHGGIMETNAVLADFHKEAAINSENVTRIETEIIIQLTGLRSDLNLKVREIKSLSGDFKSNVEKEKEATKKEVMKLQEMLEAFESNPIAGKDPYIVKLGVERQLRRQLAEENYLHRAYLNLESSGRDLEKIVVAEIQKAYGTYVRILSRDGQELIDLAERLTASTLRLPPDYEWSAFVERDPHMVNPSIPMRTIEEVEYPGRSHPVVTVVRSGMLERKSKYLKSFTPAWYVLSPTHLHEFKTPDHARDPTPVMSLYLPEASLGKYSDPSAVSHKFVLKARQTGTLHRGHSWVFRAESHAAMLEWYNAIQKLTEISGAERNEYVQRATSHKRKESQHSVGAESYSSDNSLDNDEADAVPYSGQASEFDYPPEELQPPKRPEGGRFPSDIQVNRGLEHRASMSGGSSNSAIAAAAALPGTYYPHDDYDEKAGNAHQYRDFAYPYGANTESREVDHNYVVVPSSRQKQAEVPASNEQYSVNSQQQRSQIPRTTGYGIDPITGEHESEMVRSGSGNSNVAFLGMDETVRTSLDADPREPIPPHEADAVAMDSESLDAVAVAPTPTTAEGLPRQPHARPVSSAIVDNKDPVRAPTNSTSFVPQATPPVPNQAIFPAGDNARPGSHRGNSTTAVSQSTISDLHVPGKYPNKV